MKIAFWSNYPESGVTSNMVAVCSAMSLLYQTSSILVTNHFGERDLGRALLGNNHSGIVRESEPDLISRFSNGYHGSGIPNKLRRLIDRQGDFDSRGISVIEKDKGLYYYPQGKQFSNYIYEINYDNSFGRLAGQLEAEADYVFMDLQSQGSLCSLQELEKADIVVVNLRQDESAIRNFFKRYQSLAGKCIFLISAYREDGIYIKRSFIRDFRIHPERVAVIPYNREIASGYADGRIIPYICNYINCGKKHSQYRNMWYIRYAAGILMRTLTNGIYNGNTGTLRTAN